MGQILGIIGEQELIYIPLSREFYQPKPKPETASRIRKKSSPFRCSTLLGSHPASNTHGRGIDQNPLFVFSALKPSFSQPNQQLQSIEIDGFFTGKIDEFDAKWHHLRVASRSRLRISTHRHRSISSPSPAKSNSTARSQKRSSLRSRSSSSGSFRFGFCLGFCLSVSISM